MGTESLSGDNVLLTEGVIRDISRIQVPPTVLIFCRITNITMLRCKTFIFHLMGLCPDSVV